METTERKEIIRVSGFTILVVMGLIANFLIVGYVYKFHQWKLFALEKTHNIEYAKLLKEEHVIKDEVIQLEGASSWEKTDYVRLRG